MERKIVLIGEDSPYINFLLAQLRDKNHQQDAHIFRNNVKKLGEILAYETEKGEGFGR